MLFNAPWLWLCLLAAIYSLLPKSEKPKQREFSDGVIIMEGSGFGAYLEGWAGLNRGLNLSETLKLPGTLGSVLPSLALVICFRKH